MVSSPFYISVIQIWVTNLVLLLPFLFSLIARSFPELQVSPNLGKQQSDHDLALCTPLPSAPLSKPWIPSPNIQERIWPNSVQLPSRHSPHLFHCAYSCLLLDNFMLSCSSNLPSLQDSIPHLMSPRTAFIFSVIWRFAFPGGRMLRLMQTRPEDAGQYTCIVRNAAGEERKTFGLSVLGTCGLCSI